MAFSNRFKSLFLVVSGALVTNGAVALEIEGEDHRYPQCSPTALTVTKEDYRDKYHSLATLTGLYIELDFVENTAKKNGLDIGSDFRQVVKKRVNDVGLKLYTKEEVQFVQGQPKMDIFPSMPPFEDGKPVLECCTASIWSSFSQGASILRDPSSNFVLSTWGEGGKTTDCSDLGTWLRGIVLEKIDNLLADYGKAKKEQKDFVKKVAELEPIVAEKPVEFPECNSSIILYSEIFDTDKDKVNPDSYPILDQLVGTIKNCPKYRYLVETHADQRASHEHNDDLTKRRANTISNYFLSRGVPAVRFQMAAFGKRRLATLGTSEQDYRANRRIVVVPFVIK